MAKSARTKPPDPAATAADRAVKRPVKGLVAMRESDDIARFAYALYLARGGSHGDDVADWLEAERRLQGLGKSIVI